MWSPVEKTALAEAEIEYHDHTSTTIWVRFPIVKTAIGALQGASVVIWTTTPWTIPGNRAVAAGPDIDYALVRVDAVNDGSLARTGEKILIALPLLPQVCQDAGIATHHIVHVYKGADLTSTICAHPLRGNGYDQDTPLLMGDFVTTEAGTGFVHIAPGHGEEDFHLGRAHGLEIPETVGDDGTFNPWVPGFAGQHVYKVAANMVTALTAAGGLLHAGKIVHSYPHSWRSRAPLIYRALMQFYLYYGDNFKIECPTGSGNLMNLFEVGQEIAKHRVGPQNREGLGHAFAICEFVRDLFPQHSCQKVKVGGVLSSHAKFLGPGGHDVCRGVDCASSGHGIREYGIDLFQRKTGRQFSKMTPEKLPRIDFIEQLEQDCPEEYFPGGRVAFINDPANKELANSVRSAIDIRELEC